MSWPSTYTPFGLDSTATAIIAPFFADVDTRPDGNIVEIGTGTLVVDGTPDNVFVVDWPGVGCYNENQSVTDNFQVILIDRPDLGTSDLGDDFQIEFNYDSIQWEAGEVSGGQTPSCTGAPASNSAVAGFSNGTSTPGDSFQLTGSQSTGGFLNSNPTTGLINNDLDSGGVRGRYVFTVSAGQPVTATVSTALSDAGPISIGTSDYDTATLVGATADAGGTITYGLYSDNECDDLVQDLTPEDNTFSGGGPVPDSSSYTFDSAGIFSVFVLLGAVLLRGQFTSNVTRRRAKHRRRRRSIADILGN